MAGTPSHTHTHLYRTVKTRARAVAAGRVIIQRPTQLLSGRIEKKKFFNKYSHFLN